MTARRDEPFLYLCKVCDRQWRSERVEPRCPRCGNVNETKLEVLDEPENASE